MRPNSNVEYVSRLKPPYVGAMVDMEDENRISLRIMNADGKGFAISVTRHDARMLAKRINQCLDATVKK